ncbi:hypothetical protein CDAR_23551 [Caerostris darwini]|uniref:Uncharacterized protein n=1 Tax=Caerostris darwini TaxID=1538125 RepID=A0AAV4VSI3_9ARAC|nr:hypothetical protein CDAR_23551 [Caerostris darwini]
MRLYRKSDNVKAHDRERKRMARSKPETRAHQNALQRERRVLKRQQAINPYDDNIKHTKCVQTPSLYSCSCPLKDTFNSSSSVTPSRSHCFMNNTHSDLNDYSHGKQWLKVEERFFKSIADGPTHRCYCCDRLYMKKNAYTNNASTNNANTKKQTPKMQIPMGNGAQLVQGMRIHQTHSSFII